MKLKMLLMASCLLLPISSAFADRLDDHISELKKEADIGNTVAKKELDQFTVKLQDLESKAKAGDAEAQYKLASLYEEYSSRDQEAKKLTLQSANQGYVDAQRSMYFSTQTDYRVINDTIKYKLKNDKQYDEEEKKANEEKKNKIYQELMGWVDKLLSARDERMALNLGDAYMKGDEGLQKNYTKAKDMYEKAVDFGSIRAIYKLADCYEKGLGVDKDISKVLSLYEEAGRKGDYNGYTKLYYIYHFGNYGVPIDEEKANEYKQKADQVRLSPTSE